MVADRADLYAYFFEQGVRLLKTGTGRLGYISSSTFFRTGSGEPLRRFLSSSTALETVVDFGDLQLFEGVTTYPAIVTLRRLQADEKPEGQLLFNVIRGDLPEDLATAFRAGARSMPRDRLGGGSWAFEEAGPAALRQKLRVGRQTLREVYGAPLYGIKTGLNQAFIVTREVRDRLVADTSGAHSILKPFLRGENIKRWRVESDDLFLINTPKGMINIEDYPSIRDHLMPYRTELEARATKQEWFELQQAQYAYQSKFAVPKIIYGHFAAERIFCFDDAGLFPNDKGYAIPGGDYFLLALLNSKLEWFLLSALAPAVRGGYHEMRVQYVGVLPIPESSTRVRARLSDLAELCQKHATERHRIKADTRHRLSDLCPAGLNRRISTKLYEWWTLDFPAFRSEIKKVFKQDVPLSERTAWETYLKTEAGKVKHLSREIEHAEQEIDALVYALFDLSSEEIAIVEATVGGGPRQKAA